MRVAKPVICLGCLWLGALLGGYWTPRCEAQGVIGAVRPSETIDWHNLLAKNFKSGKTNDIRLLRMDWFSDPNIVSPGYYQLHWFSLDPSGQASMGISSISNGGYMYLLDKAKLHSILEAVDMLPASPKKTLPYERQILISGIRNNQWFHAVYDRANIPKEVTELFKLSGAGLEAYKP